MDLCGFILRQLEDNMIYHSDNALIHNPIKVVFVFEEKSYLEYMKSIGVSSPIPFSGPDSNARIIHELVDDLHYNIVCFNLESLARFDHIQIMSIIVHEMVHAFQYYKQLVGEDNPSDEFEAYAIQRLCQNAFCAYKEYTEMQLKKAIAKDEKKALKKKHKKVKIK